MSIHTKGMSPFGLAEICFPHASARGRGCRSKHAPSSQAPVGDGSTTLPNPLCEHGGRGEQDSAKESYATWPGARKRQLKKRADFSILCGRMKVAAIDIGSNSIRTVIAQVHGDGTFHIVDQLKDMTRLAEGETPETGLSPRAIHDGLQSLAKSKAICDAHKVDRVIASATSAVREARNSARFIELVKQQTGIQVNIISAEEEARLIYLGVREAIRLGERRALIVDIGGGSTEFIIGSDSQLQFTASVKLGVLRLLNLFPLSDPASLEQVQTLGSFISERLDTVLAQMRQLGFDQVIGTSGTSLTLFNLALQQGRKNGRVTGSLNNRAIPAPNLSAVCDGLLASTTAERRLLERIQPERLDSIVMGAALWKHLISELGMTEIVACRFALREGMLVDFGYRHAAELRGEEEYPDPRRRSVLALAERCHVDPRHGQQVADLALSLFDQLRPVHALDHRAREWLEYAALLHDCGYHIGAKGHHKHSHYLIVHGDLIGFKPAEVQSIASIARYHRRREPTRNDWELQGLDQSQRHTIKVLSGILRIAEGLDRTHFRMVEGVHVRAGSRRMDLYVLTRGDAELELWFASERATLLQEALKMHVRIYAGTPDASASPVDRLAEARREPQASMGPASDNQSPLNRE